MDDVQTWTLIGGFLAVLVAMTSMTLRVVRAEIGGLRGEMNARFDAVDHRIDHLDRDVRAVVARLMDS